MPRKFTAEELISQVRDEARIPNTASTGNTDADMLNRINDYVIGSLHGAVMEVKDEYFVRSTRTDLLADTSRYVLPSRAMYGKLRDLKYYRDDVKQYRPLAHIPIGDIDLWNWNQNAVDYPGAFYVEGNYVVLWPPVAGSPNGKLEMSFYLAPGEIVLSTAVAVVESVTAKVITCTAALPTTLAAGTSFDVHSATSGAELKIWDRAGSAAGSAVTLTGEDPDGSVFGEYAVVPGDYVCLAGESALPGVPRELHPLIGMGAACSILEDEGDLEVFQVKYATLQRQLYGSGDGKTPGGAIGNLHNRVEAKPKYVKGGIFIANQGWY